MSTLAPSPNLRRIRRSLYELKRNLRAAVSIDDTESPSYVEVLNKIDDSVRRTASGTTEDEARIVFDELRAHINERAPRLFGSTFATDSIYLGLNRSTLGTAGLARSDSARPQNVPSSAASTGTSSNRTSPDTATTSLTSPDPGPQPPLPPPAGHLSHPPVLPPSGPLHTQFYDDGSGNLTHAQQRLQYQTYQHHSERRLPGPSGDGQFYGPTPNPERAHESPATRHFPSRTEEEGEGQERDREEEESQ